MIKENGLGSNYRTLNNNPISHFNDSRVEVEMYPTAWGKFGASVICRDMDFNSGLREFDTEEAAKLFALNTHDMLVRKLDAKILENVITRILEHHYSGK